MQPVTTYFLEMHHPNELVAKTDTKGLHIIEAELNAYQFNRFLYAYIGEAWQWTDKLALPDAAWQAYVDNPNLRTWAAYYKGAIAGYYELHAEADGNTEIAYFGLAKPFIGHGMGGYLLSQAICCAWRIPSTKRVWVHTCSLDHPSALNNYQARGLKVYKTETE